MCKRTSTSQQRILRNGDTGLILMLMMTLTWLNGRVPGESSTSIRPETFWVACDMALERRYNLAVPYLAWAYNRLGHSKQLKANFRDHTGLGP